MLNSLGFFYGSGFIKKPHVSIKNKATEPEIPTQDPPVFDDELKQVRHLTVYNLIVSASEKVIILNKNIQELLPKEENFKIARDDIKDVDLTNDYRKQIDDIKKNIDDGYIEYMGIITQLTSFQDAIVIREFDIYKEDLIYIKKRFDYSVVNEQVKKHYNQFLKDGLISKETWTSDIRNVISN